MIVSVMISSRQTRQYPMFKAKIDRLALIRRSADNYQSANDLTIRQKASAWI